MVTSTPTSPPRASVGFGLTTDAICCNVRFRSLIIRAGIGLAPLEDSTCVALKQRPAAGGPGGPMEERVRQSCRNYGFAGVLLWLVCLSVVTEPSGCCTVFSPFA